MPGPLTPDAARRSEARRLFGEDVAGYDAGRLPYIERTHEILIERCRLAPGTRVLEIGPGSGRATRRLADSGAAVVGVEPDSRLASHLRRAFPDIEVLQGAFEDVELPEAGFDVVVAASSFHWVDQDEGLPRLRRVLRRGGWLALWWERFGDDIRSDPFHDATADLLPPPNTAADGRPPYQLDVEGWREVLSERAGIEDLEAEVISGTARLDSGQLRALYASWSNFRRLPAVERETLLDRLVGIAEADFGGIVERPRVTAIYTARRG